MDGVAKDLLQLGFSFFVAGYLLVWGRGALEELRSMSRVQGEQLREVVSLLREVRDGLGRVRG